MTENTRSPQLELRERDTSGRHAVEKVVAFGTEQPVVLIEFIGEVGVRLDRIVIESTGWSTEELASLFEDIARTIRSRPDTVAEHTD